MAIKCDKCGKEKESIAQEDGSIEVAETDYTKLELTEVPFGDERDPIHTLFSVDLCKNCGDELIGIFKKIKPKQKTENP